jgi:hypothetical protein
MLVITDLVPRPDHHVAVELLVRVVAAALAVAGILGLLPAVAGLAS